jgi:hypothetical protein
LQAAIAEALLSGASVITTAIRMTGIKRANLSPTLRNVTHSLNTDRRCADNKPISPRSNEKSRLSVRAQAFRTGNRASSSAKGRRAFLRCTTSGHKSGHLAVSINTHLGQIVGSNIRDKQHPDTAHHKKFTEIFVTILFADKYSIDKNRSNRLFSQEAKIYSQLLIIFLQNNPTLPPYREENT